MRITRSAALAASAVAGAVALAACGSSGSTAGGGGSSSASSGGGSGKTYAIACQGPLTGDNAALGINICDGAKLAVQQATGLPFKLTYTQADDQGDPGQSPTAAQQLIGNSQVVAVVGPAFSGATQAAEPLFTQAGLASVTASATLPTLTDAKNGFKTFFRAVANDSAQGAGAASYLAKTLQVKKVYSVNDKSAYGVGLAAELDKDLKADGVTVTDDAVPAGTKQYEAEATKVAGSGADALYYSGYYADFGPFAKALRNAGFKGVLMSDDGAKDPNYLKLAGTTAAAGTYFSCPCTDATADSSDASFVSAYTSAFNTAPGTYSAEAYDAANAVISVMKGLNGNVSRGSVVTGLKSVDYKGITKTVQFASNGEITDKAAFIYQVQGSDIKLLGPSDSAPKGTS